MTLHTAKGLEWPVVAVTGLEDGLFPLSRSLETQNGIEEERRLFYVGLTRAKDKLYLSWARARRRGGDLRPAMVSRFMEAIPDALIEEKSTASLWSSKRVSGGWLAPWESVTAPRATPVRLYAINEDELNQDAPRLIRGERVRHRRFGSGTVQGLAGVGKDLKVSVLFDDETVGLKQLLVAFAALERDWGE
jgi:DNA helicase-2/ATP-dependent DNA helicase PcrA